MRSIPIARRPWDHEDVPSFLERGEPVVLTNGCPLARDIAARWSFDHLASMFDGSEKLQVHFSSDKDGHGPTFARVYGEGLGDGGVTLMSFQQFVDSCKREQPGCRHYLAAPLVRKPAESTYTLTPIEYQNVEGNLTYEGCCAGASRVIEELQTGIDWAWLADAQARCQDGTPFDMAQIWAGSGVGTTPLHFDALSNMFAQLQGKKRVLLYPTSQTFCLYPFPVGHPRDNFAMVDPITPDLCKFPALGSAIAHEAMIEPGEVLFIPRYTWHHVSQVTDAVNDTVRENLSLNFWFGLKGTGSFKRELWAAAKERKLPEHVITAAMSEVAASNASNINVSPDQDTLLVPKPEELEDLLDSPVLAIRALLAARHVEGCTTELLDSTEAAGEFLKHLATGEHEIWKQGSVRARHAVHTVSGARSCMPIKCRRVALSERAHHGTRLRGR